MKTLRLAYHSMWPDHDPEKQPRDFFRWCLEQHYLVEIDNINPDIVIYSVFGDPPMKSQWASEPILVAYSGESHDAQGNFDLSFGHHMHADSKYKRLPHWVLYIDWNLNKYSANHPLDISHILSRHTGEWQPRPNFCNFTYRNPVKSRIEFFLALNQVNRVHSTGPLFNNQGFCLQDKTLELQSYRFTIAWENTQLPGYVTEKLLQPLAAGSIPIYCGGSESIRDFNPHAFINRDDFKSNQDMIDWIMHVNSNEKLLQRYWQEPIWCNPQDWPEQVFSWIHDALNVNKPHLGIR